MISHASKECAGDNDCDQSSDDDNQAFVQKITKRHTHSASTAALSDTLLAQQPYVDYRRGNGGWNSEPPPPQLQAGAAGIKWNVDGEEKMFYLPGADIENQTTVRLTPPYRFYLMKYDTNDTSNESNFQKLDLLGKTFEVDIKYENVGCGCNANFYLVDMPASSPGKDGDYYCDAQCSADYGCCSEFDMNEGSTQVQQITNHACEGMGYYTEFNENWTCDQWGLSPYGPYQKFLDNEFGKGDANKIDSTRPFTFRQEFKAHPEGSENFVVDTTIMQGENHVKKRLGPSFELNKMFKQIHEKNGFVYVTGYWTSHHMNWLDADTCGSQTVEECGNGPAFMSNFRIYPNPPPGPVPPGPPTPVQYCCYHPEDTCPFKPDSCNPPGQHCSSSPNACSDCGGRTCYFGPDMF